MVNRVPFLLSAVECGADLLPQGTTHDMDEFFANMFREFSMTLHGSEFAEIAAPLAMVVQCQPFQQHCLAHYPKGPNCEVCLQAKMCRAPASRKPMFEDAKQVAQVHGERIHCDLVGPTRPSINDEVYAMIIHDDAKGYPAARALRIKQASETAAAFDDMHGNQAVKAVRTDNGGDSANSLQISSRTRFAVSILCRVVPRQIPGRSVFTVQLRKAWLACLWRRECHVCFGHSVSWHFFSCMPAAPELGAHHLHMSYASIAHSS